MDRILSTNIAPDVQPPAAPAPASHDSPFRMMTRRANRFAALLLLAGAPPAIAQDPAASSAQVAAPPVAAPPVVEAEPVDTALLKPAHPRRLMLSGSMFGGVRMIDGNTAKMEAMLYSGNYSSFVADPGQHAFYIAQTSWTRGNHGKREDYLTIHDGSSLKAVAEVDLPGRLISTPKTNSIDVSADGKRVYVFNLEPAASVVTVRTDLRKVESVTEIPGCGLVYAWGPAGFATLCADGSLATVSLDVKGRGTVDHSPVFFDPEKDPIFDESIVDRQTGKAFLLSYSGLIYPAQIGARTVVGEGWSVQRAAGLSPASVEPGQRTWRPGGRRLMAFHRSSGRLYILMHEGEHWTQKEAGSQVWVIDTDKRAVVAKLTVPTSAEVIAVSQDDKPQVFALASGGRLWVMDAATGEVLRTKTGYGAMTAAVAGF